MQSIAVKSEVSRMNELSGEDFEKGLDEYDAEQRVFPAISERVESDAPLTK